MEKENKDNFYKEAQITYSEADCGLVLKPYALFNLLQDLASYNAEKLDFGYTATTVKQNLGWVLLKYHMEFSDYPDSLFKLIIKTDIRGYNKLFTFRDFSLYKENNLIGRVSSMWALINLETKKMVSPPSVLETPYMVPFEKRENDMAYSKIKPLSRVDEEKTCEIRFDDIDVNGHVNNAVYIVFAFEPLPYEFRLSKKPKIIDMVYKKEVRYGTKIISKVEINDDVTNHILLNADTGEECCNVLCQWRSR